MRCSPALVLSLVLLLVPACRRVEPAPKARAALELTGAVVDRADVLEVTAEARLTQKLLAAQNAYGPQMVVVTTPTLNGQSVKKYSLDLANDWGLGDAKRADGLLLLLAPKERTVRIEVGTGLEGSFNDRFAKKIIDETLIPRFKNGEFQAGVEAAVDQMIAKMKAVPTITANDNASSNAKDKAA